MPEPIKVDCYTVRVPERLGPWGFFFVHPNGVFVAHTDFGTFGYAWTCHGDTSIKHFLSKLTDTEYLLGKICKREVFDAEATRRVFVRSILDYRRQGSLTKDQARELYDNLPGDGRSIMEWAQDQEALRGFDWYEWGVYDFPPEARAFAEKLFPLFREWLKAELAHAA